MATRLTHAIFFQISLLSYVLLAMHLGRALVLWEKKEFLDLYDFPVPFHLDNLPLEYQHDVREAMSPNSYADGAEWPYWS